MSRMISPVSAWMTVGSARGGETCALQHGSWKGPATVRRFSSGVTDQTLARPMAIQGWGSEGARESGFRPSDGCAETYLFDTLEHMKQPIFDTLVETASDHHGYVTTIQAREAGVDPTQLRLLAGRGRLEHVARGVYRVPVLPRSQHDDLAFAIAWARGRAVISHESALILHGLSDVNPSVVHLTAPRDNHPRAQGGGPVRVHRRGLPADDVTMVDGIPVTTVARTIEDCYELGTDPAQLQLAVRQARQTGDLAPAQAEQLKQLIGHQVVPR